MSELVPPLVELFVNGQHDASDNVSTRTIAADGRDVADAQHGCHITVGVDSVTGTPTALPPVLARLPHYR